MLSGGAGVDMLIGGAGDDTMTGGADDDTFVFDLDDGADRITDFEAGGLNDVMTFSADFGFADWTDVLALAEQSGGDTIFYLGAGDKLILEGVAKASLTAEDFTIYT